MLGIERAEAKAAVARSVGIRWESIHDSLFDKLKEEFAQDDEIRTFAEDKREKFKSLRTLYEDEPHALEKILYSFVGEIRWNSNNINEKCYLKMKGLKKSSDGTYADIIDEIINCKDDSRHFIEAGVICDD